MMETGVAAGAAGVSARAETADILDVVHLHKKLPENTINFFYK
jgi:hypothetical protein